MMELLHRVRCRPLCCSLHNLETSSLQNLGSDLKQRLQIPLLMLEPGPSAASLLMLEGKGSELATLEEQSMSCQALYDLQVAIPKLFSLGK